MFAAEDGTIPANSQIIEHLCSDLQVVHMDVRILMLAWYVSLASILFIVHYVVIVANLVKNIQENASKKAKIFHI
ncbi:hypothetical protein Tco_0581960, partial [Tanacetum coccineum]